MSGERLITPQEAFWAGDFGTVYTERNQPNPQARAPFFRQVLARTQGVQSVCELGANRGHNLLALQAIDPALRLTGLELNPDAFRHLSALPGIQAVLGAIQDFQPDQRFDLTLTCGVLIHLPPEDLPAAYARLIELSRRYVLINEYYHPTPVEVSYRGHAGRLFKRDFGADLLDAGANRLKLLDYGFLWHRAHPAWDNTTWWLFEKTD